MGVTMLRIDRSKLKWRIKLQSAFEPKPVKTVDEDGEIVDQPNVEGRSGKWTLFIIPMITVLREGLEAVVFIAGVSASGLYPQSAELTRFLGIAWTTCHCHSYRRPYRHRLWSHHRMYVILLARFERN